MIVVHIDTTSDAHTLIDCYRCAKDTDIILVNPTKREVINALTERPNDILMGLGHGSPSGLFGCDYGNVIDGSMVNLLKDREIVGIWCHAKDFGKRYGLKGFFTSMFVSNPSEASWYRFKKVDTSVTQEQNTIFSKQVNDFLDKNLPLNEWIANLKYDDSLDFVKFNYENIEYLDGSTTTLNEDYMPYMYEFDEKEVEPIKPDYASRYDDLSVIDDLGASNDICLDCISSIRSNISEYNSFYTPISKAKLDRWEKTLLEIQRYAYGMEDEDDLINTEDDNDLF